MHLGRTMRLAACRNMAGSQGTMHFLRHCIPALNSIQGFAAVLCWPDRLTSTWLDLLSSLNNRPGQLHGEMPDTSVSPCCPRLFHGPAAPPTPRHT